MTLAKIKQLTNSSSTCNSSHHRNWKLHKTLYTQLTLRHSAETFYSFKFLTCNSGVPSPLMKMAGINETWGALSIFHPTLRPHEAIIIPLPGVSICLSPEQVRLASNYSFFSVNRSARFLPSLLTQT